MTDFTFTSTSECDMCGKYLSSSDEECDHDGHTVETHVFRRMNEGRDSMVGVKSTTQHKWYALEEKIGDDWIAYQWLGTRDEVNSSLKRYDCFAKIPMRAMSLDAPTDVGESKH